MKYIFIILVAIVFSACGSSSSSKKVVNQNIDEGASQNISKRVGYYRDSTIEGVHYSCGAWSGTLDNFGRFYFERNKGCSFTIADITIKVISAYDLLNSPVVVEEDPNVARMLQILDYDGDPTNNLTIISSVEEEIKKAGIKSVPSSEAEFQKLYDAAKKANGYNGILKTQKEALTHMQEELPDTVPPTIILNGKSNIKIRFAQKYIDAGATASDDIDGDISDKIKVSGSVNTNKAGNYTIYFDVEDSSHNKAKQEKRVVTVLAKPDTTPPALKLNGDSNITINLNESYKELGAYANDNIDGNISNNIKISGNVDTTNEGLYIITYTISDKAGNSSTLKRGVKVINPNVDIEDEIVNRHNYYRSLVFSGHELSWDDELAKHAQEWADYLAEHYNKDDSWPSPHASSFEQDLHNYGDANEGENITWNSIVGIPFVAPEPIDIDNENVTSSLFPIDSWAAEKSFYDYETNSQKSGWEHKPVGHYTQLVWQDTQKVGCAKAKSKTDLEGEWFVCRYKEPGNITINGVKQKPYILDEDIQLPTTSESKELIWNDEEPKKLNYNDAVKYCSALDIDGFNDWRLPEITELLTLPNYKASRGEKMNSLVLNSIKDGFYWSNTRSGTSTSWGARLSSKVSSYEVLNYQLSRGKEENVICVRGGLMPIEDRFSRKDGVVYDNLTNLQWQDQYDRGELDLIWASSTSDYCQSLSIDNYGGWRTPNIKELLSIIQVDSNRGKYFDIFQTRKQSVLTYTYSNDSAPNSDTQNHWLAGIDDGNSNFEVYHHVCPPGKDTRAYIRCVRDKNSVSMSSTK